MSDKCEQCKKELTSTYYAWKHVDLNNELLMFCNEDCIINYQKRCGVEIDMLVKAAHKISDFEYDEDFPMKFCPVCGTDDITSGGEYDKLFNKDKTDMRCWQCGWEVLMYIVKKGDEPVSVYRLDEKDCGVCKDRLKEHGY